MVFEWEWMRYFSPFINHDLFVLLFGGAFHLAIKYHRQKDKEAHFRRNIFIASCAWMTGILGSLTRMGYANVLFVAEMIGLILFYTGYNIIKMNKGNSLAE